MQIEQIDQLRAAVLDGNSVAWNPDHDTCKIVRSVPAEEWDPDRTGVKDFIAIFESGGHVDLSNAVAEDFKVVIPLFQELTNKRREDQS